MKVIRSLFMLSAVSGAAIAQTPPAPPAQTKPPVVSSPAVPGKPSLRTPVAPAIAIDADDLERRLRLGGVKVYSTPVAVEAITADVARIASEAVARTAPIAMAAAQQAVQVVPQVVTKAMSDWDFQYSYNWNSHADFGPRFQSDPADSLYRQAIGLFNAGDWRAAAQRFKEVQTKYPNTQYLSRSMYYQAFSLYRAGSDNELREAVTVLDQVQQKFPNARYNSGTNLNDAYSLQMRVKSYLAERGDAQSRRDVASAAGTSGQTCDREQQAMKRDALSALMRMDPDAAMPKLTEVLALRDECSTQLRRDALSILTRRGDEKAVATLLSTAKSDPSPSIRADALQYVSRFPSDQVYQTLESVARTETVEEVRRAAARSLVGYPSPRARDAVRLLIEDNTIPDGIRNEMLSRFSSETANADDITWLKASYPKVTSPSVKRSIVNAVGRIGGADAQKWLMELAVDDRETAGVRADAFRRSSSNMTVAQLSKAYDDAGARPMKQQIINALNERKEPEALDKLIDIVKNPRETDPEIRMQVFNTLSQRKDPRVTKLLLELIDKK